MRKIILFLSALLPIVTQAQLQQHQQHHHRRNEHKPKLVVNIVVGGLPYDLLEKVGGNLSDEGFARFAADGTDFSAAYYNYMQTLSPVSLATLTTGVDPSMHGVVAGGWIDHVTGARVSLIDDPEVEGVGGDAGTGHYSPLHIVMPTLGDKLLAESPESKVFSVAADPVSAVVAGGRSGVAYWLDEGRATWVSSSHYMPRLPDWAVVYNTGRPANFYVETGWTPARPLKQYVARTSTIFAGTSDGSGNKVTGGARITSFRKGSAVDYAGLVQSPAGNTLVADFAKQLVVGEELGADDATDILNVCFDASRWVGERYGAGSMEVEDMLYRLDIDLGGLVRAITAQVHIADVLFVVTSDHGLSGSAGDAGRQERFNAAQFKTILNSFLGVQFGTGDWVLDYIDRQVYLNRNLVYKMNLSLEEVQNRAAAFVLQFRGVSHVLTSTALGGGYFGAGYGQMMQNSFYPRRAGDLMLNFMPGWIEEQAVGSGTSDGDGPARSLSGSMYDYDTHVPLVIFGWKIPARRVDEPVDMTLVAPTLARIIGVGRPIASDGAMLPEVIND